MKKLIALMMVCCLILPVLSLAEEAELDLEEIVEDVDLEEDFIYDEETGETFALTTEEQQKMRELVEEDEELDESEAIDPDSLEMNPNLPDNVINILLIGVDTRSNDPQNITGLGDTEIIVSINKDTKTIKMTSILRDSLVTIPGYKNQNTINCAYQFGNNKIKKGTTQEKVRSGAALAMRTINRNFQMNIENFVAINFNGLASIIDDLGGIDIELTAAEAKYINSYLRRNPPKYDNKAKGERVALEPVAGTQHLDGVQAVMYARIRSLNGENDFNRTDRQRHLLDLLLKKVMESKDALVLMNLMETAVSYAATNMNMKTMLSLVQTLYPVLMNADTSVSLFEQMRIPMDHSYSYSTTSTGHSCIKYNLAKHAQAIHEFVYGTYYPAK